LIAEGVKEPADIIAEAKKRWKMTVSKPTVYNIKSSGKGKKKAKAKPKAKAKATAKKGSTQGAVKALKGWPISRAWRKPESCWTSWKRWGIWKGC